MATLLEQSTDPLTLIGKLGESFGVSGMFGCKTKEQGHVLALHCVMENVSPLTILQTYHFIEGKLSMRADAMLGRANAAGFKHKVLSRTADLATIYMSDSDDDGQEFSLSWAECQKEPFVKDKTGNIKTNYATPRARMQMLWARVASEAVRAMCPQVVCGAYTPEEIEDFVEPAATSAEAPTSAAPATVATERKTRKKSDQQESATVSAEAVKQQAPAEEPSQQTEAKTEAVAEVDAPPATATQPAAEAEKAVDPAPSKPALPQKVVDIVALRDYVGPRWPANHKHGDWPHLWALVKQRLNIPVGESDEEQFCKAPESTRDKAITWLNQQRAIVDKMETSKDLSTWANQQPSTAATAAAKA